MNLIDGDVLKYRGRYKYVLKKTLILVILKYQMYLYLILCGANNQN